MGKARGIRKMKGAVLYETGSRLVVEELELPELLPGQVLVRILASGVCRAQLNEITAHKGPDIYLPHTLGHEASGIVEDTGKGVTKVRKGDYVVLTWIKGLGMDIPGCSYRSAGTGKKINSGAVTTFSEYSVVSENRVVKIPQEVRPEVAALFGCAIPTGVGIVSNQLKLRKGDSVAVFGIGGIGASVLLGAASAGASPIIAVDVSQAKLDFAGQNGADFLVNPTKDDPVAAIRKITSGKGVDYSVDCAGIPKAIEQAFESLNDAGLCVVAGNPAKGEKISIVPFDLIKGKRIIGSWGGAVMPDRDIPLFIGAYLSGKLRADRLATKEFSLDRINDAVDTLRKGEVIRAIVRIGL